MDFGLLKLLSVQKSDSGLESAVSKIRGLRICGWLRLLRFSLSEQETNGNSVFRLDHHSLRASGGSEDVAPKLANSRTGSKRRNSTGVGCR